MSLLSILVGLVVGWNWERYATSPRGNHSALFASIVIPIGSKNLHLHHWIYYFILFMVSIYWYSNSKGAFSDLALLLLAASVAAMAYNFKKYPDWHKFIR